MRKITRLIPVLFATVALAACGNGGEASQSERHISIGQAAARTCFEIKNEIQRKYDMLDNWDENQLGNYGYLIALYLDLCTEADVEVLDDDATE